MKHLKLFENTAQYLSWKNGNDFVLSNVCYITESGEIKYITESNNIIAIFNIEEPRNFYLCSNLNNISTILINGVDVGLIQSYNFEEAGKYTVEFVLVDNTFIADNHFSGIRNLYSITVPNTVKAIGSNAFMYMQNLKYLTIGKSVISIGSTALHGTDSVLEITSLAKVAPQLNNLWGSDKVNSKGGVTLYYPKGSDYSTWFETQGVYPQEMWEYSELPKNPENPIGLFYNRTAETPVRIFSGRLLFADPTEIVAIKIDGESYLLSDFALDSNSIDAGYIFNSPGHHTVEYVLNKEATNRLEWNMLFFNTDVISISIPNWFTVPMEVLSYFLHSINFSDITQIISLEDCYNLSCITIPEQTESIPDWFFNNCIKLKEITSLSITAPQLGDIVFGDEYSGRIHDTGVLRHPKGSDYNTWITALPSGWTVEELA